MNDSQRAQLLTAARHVSEKACAPYSGIPRGAALLAEDGTVYCGTNVEFATYNGSLCAEMIALGQAIADGKRKFTALALSPFGFPCCCCRQGLAEFGTDVEIFSQDTSGKVVSYSLSQLLPETFGKSHLG